MTRKKVEHPGIAVTTVLNPTTKLILQVLARDENRSLSQMVSNILESSLSIPIMEKKVLAVATQQVEHDKQRGRLTAESPALQLLAIFEDAQKSAASVENSPGEPVQPSQAPRAPTESLRPPREIRARRQEPQAEPPRLSDPEAVLDELVPPGQRGPRVVAAYAPPPEDSASPAAPGETSTIVGDEDPPDLLPEGKSVPRGLIGQALREED